MHIKLYYRFLRPPIKEILRLSFILPQVLRAMVVLLLYWSLIPSNTPSYFVALFLAKGVFFCFSLWIFLLSNFLCCICKALHFCILHNVHFLGCRGYFFPQLPVVCLFLSIFLSDCKEFFFLRCSLLIICDFLFLMCCFFVMDSLVHALFSLCSCLMALQWSSDRDCLLSIFLSCSFHWMWDLFVVSDVMVMVLLCVSSDINFCHSLLSWFIGEGYFLCWHSYKTGHIYTKRDVIIW